MEINKEFYIIEDALFFMYKAIILYFDHLQCVQGIIKEEAD